MFELAEQSEGIVSGERRNVYHSNFAEVGMGGRDKEPHQPEPWTQEGRYILDAGQWTLASTKFPADARRIVAAVNAVRGIPTDALESWVINVIGDQVARRGGDRRGPPAEGVYPNDRRTGERRRGERRASRPEIQIWAGAPPAPEPPDESQGADLEEK